MKDILIVLNGGNSKHVVEEACRVAQSDSKQIRALQILDSGLYFYGHNDLVAPRLSKRTYLLYIREQVIEQGKIEAGELREKAHNMGISLDIAPIETDDVISTVIAEAQKGYGQIFLAKEERKLFPLLKRHLARHLRKNVSAKVIEC